MTDPYYERIVTLHQQLAARHGKPERDSDAELIAQLTTPTAEEVAYTAPDARVHEVRVGATTGEFSVRVYQPLTDDHSRPLLVWSHGGAFVGGDIDMPEADAVARELATRADAVVVSVDYRLCHDGVHYPTPNNDVDAALEWAVEHAASLGADPDRVSIGGASAGACLSAAVTLRRRDRGTILPSSVVLAYPVVHPVLPEPSAELAEKLRGLPASMAFTPEIFAPVVENYMGTSVDDAFPYAVPGLAADLSGFPPTLIVNCEHDGLRASGERFAEQLRAADVHVVATTAHGVAHGHLNRPGLSQANQTLADIAEWVGKSRAVKEVEG